MDFRNYFDSAEAQLALFIKMAKADGEIIQAEMMFLKLLAHKLNINSSDFDTILDNYEKYRYLPPANEKERFMTLYILIQMMKVDLSMKAEEIEFCLEIGKRLHIDEDKMKNIIELSKQQEKKVVGYEEIKKELKPIL
ncbi:TerB family tellurite resistance protein [Carboxylicivirga sp. M1479]|uniref:tellurite resistance TerB family protein n=1 Tax=Carboxylicivirga sp. M1479 TaxID=2594476 RepID=UPI0011774084|nr:TerB family tellurite resistance protein [Carboxylicivirga sp. M1479]TRX71206.1 TerB family tellurite resistance protein [Carboxylicivirga sp. M1479]